MIKFNLYLSIGYKMNLLKNRKKTIYKSEHEEQVKVCQYLDLLKKLYYAIPNGIFLKDKTSSYQIIAKMKKEGFKIGVPDICISEPSQQYHGLYIEMKKEKGGKASSEQNYWIDALLKRGYKAVVCFGFIEAKKVIDEYFNIK